MGKDQIIQINFKYSSMKKILVLLLAAMASIYGADAQSQKKIAKEYRQFEKAAENELNSKVLRDARKGARQYKREGWQTIPGHLPIERQLDDIYKMRRFRDENLNFKYVTAEGVSIGEHYDAAKMQASEVAKLRLAGSISEDVHAVIRNSIANKQLTAGEAASITEIVSASENRISQRLGRVVPIVELYRTLPNGNKEVLVMVAYSSELAKEAARQVVREELQKKADKLLLEKFDGAF